MNQRKCEICGGVLASKWGGALVCESCDAVYSLQERAAEENILLVKAYENLRKGEFETSEELFLSICQSYPKCHGAYFGALLSKHGIVFVDDLQSNKKVPTCHNITISDVMKDALLQKAIACAPAEVAENYKQMAAKVEKIREEWLSKASKEQPYDIFICFKDSDRENGIDRTADSIEAANLYTHLSKKYNVFFSRESLRDKVAEQYEPYIFNALSTAKVMIVYGQKSEYFMSTWVKNEWSRYIGKIRDGQKQPNSLVVAYEKMNVYDLPKVLAARQCLDAGQKTFYMDLESHITKVLGAEKKTRVIEKVEIKTGVVSKKVDKVAISHVETREFGVVNITSLTANEEQQLQIGEKYLALSKYENAESVFSKLYKANPKNCRAIEGYMQAVSNAHTIESYFSQLFNNEAWEKVLTLIDFSEKAKAEKYGQYLGENLNFCMDKKENMKALECAKHFFEYDFPTREAAINNVLVYSSEHTQEELFAVALEMAGDPDTDFHIRWNLSIAEGFRSQRNVAGAKKYISRVLELDNGNLKALWLELLFRIGSKGSSDDSKKIAEQTDIKAFEKLFSFCGSAEMVDTKIFGIIGCLKREQKIANASGNSLFDQLVRRISSETLLESQLLEYADSLLKIGAFENAKKYYGLVLSKDETHIGARLGLLLVSYRAKSEQEVFVSKKPLKKCPQYQDLLNAAILDDMRFADIAEFENKQKVAVAEKKELVAKKRPPMAWAISTLAAFCLFIVLVILSQNGIVFGMSRTVYWICGFTLYFLVCGLIYCLDMKIHGDRARNTGRVFASGCIIIYIVAILGLAIGLNFGCTIFEFTGGNVFFGTIITTLIFGAVWFALYGIGLLIKVAKRKWGGALFTVLLAALVVTQTAMGGLSLFRNSAWENMTTPYESNGVTYADKVAIHEYIWGSNNIDASDIPTVIGGKKVVELGEFYRNNLQITSAKIPYGIIKLSGTFSYCRNLVKVELPSSIEMIAEDSFYNCEKLQKIKFREGLEIIGENAFTLCSSLRDVYIPESVTEIGMSAFGGSPTVLHIKNMTKIKISANWNGMKMYDAPYKIDPNSKICANCMHY